MALLFQERRNKNIEKNCSHTIEFLFDCFEAPTKRALASGGLFAEFVNCKLCVVLFVTFNR